MRKIQIILSDDKNNSISAESTIENLNNIMESINLNGIDVMIAKQLQELNKVNKINVLCKTQVLSVKIRIIINDIDNHKSIECETTLDELPKINEIIYKKYLELNELCPIDSNLLSENQLKFINSNSFNTYQIT